MMVAMAVGVEVAEAVISGVQLHWSASVYQQCL